MLCLLGLVAFYSLFHRADLERKGVRPHTGNSRERVDPVLGLSAREAQLRSLHSKHDKEHGQYDDGDENDHSFVERGGSRGAAKYAATDLIAAVGAELCFVVDLCAAVRAPTALVALVPEALNVRV